MSVSNDDACNFCYVLPKADPDTTLEDTLIVVPNFLHMGWCKSPTLFCAALETARDVIEALLLEASLPEHPFKEKMLDTSSTLQLQATIHFSNLVEVFEDYFIVATSNISKEHLEHLSRTMLLGVKLILPPLEVPGHHGKYTVSQNKLNQGECAWGYTKEILGWLVDSADFTLQLMPYKCVKISNLIKKLFKQSYCPLQKFQELAGKLQHASFGIPGGGAVLTHTRGTKNRLQIGQAHTVYQSNASILENPSPTPCAAPNPGPIAG